MIDAIVERIENYTPNDEKDGFKFESIVKNRNLIAQNHLPQSLHQLNFIASKLVLFSYPISFACWQNISNAGIKLLVIGTIFIVL